MSEKQKPQKKVENQSKNKLRKQAATKKAKAAGITTRKDGQAFPVPEMHPFAQANLYPFSAEAMGVKVPDEATMPSDTNYIRGMDTVVIDAAQSCQVRAFRTDPNARQIVPASITSTTAWVWNASWTSGVSTIGTAQITNMKAAYSVARVVAGGLRLNCRLSATNAAGSVHIAIVGEDLTKLPTTTYPSTISDMQNSPWYAKVALGDLIDDTVLVPFKFTDQGAFRYRSIAQGWNIAGTAIAAGLESTLGWGVIIIAVEGAALSASALDVDWIYHYEGLLNVGSTLSTGSKGAPYSPLVMAATKNLVDAVPAIRKESKTSFWPTVKKLWNAGWKIASGFNPALTPLAALATSIST